MSSPPRLRATPLPVPISPRSPSPNAGVASPPATGGEALRDEAIWKKLREAGFDEESVKRRDKAALIAYITNLETQVYDLHYHMGLLLLEKKEWDSSYEEAKSASITVELSYKREQAAHLSALAEAMKREEGLKKSLSIEKLCVSNLEKALHDLRAESAERKVDCDSKLSQARSMSEEAQNKLDEAESKLHEARLLHSEANRSRDSALRRLQDVEAREDDLRRRLNSLNSSSDAKEKEISDMRQTLFDSQKVLHQEQERLREGQNLLNQREAFIFERSMALSSSEKDLEETKAKLDDGSRILKDERSNLDLDMAALLSREQEVVQRESLIEKRERELLVMLEKVSNKEYEEFKRLSDEHYSTIEKKRSELEAEIERRRILFEDDLKERGAYIETREDDLNQRGKMIDERDHALEVKAMQLTELQEDLEKKFKVLEDREQSLQSIEKGRETEMLKIQSERERIRELKEELEKLKATVEDEKGNIIFEQERLKLTENERIELRFLEVKLKEEIDSFRALKIEILAEADILKAEKEKFETEWELIDEKREELRKETERVSEERASISAFLKSEYNNIKLEKEILHNQFKKDADSLACERGEFVSKMESEHSAWFNKIQHERDHFMQDIKIQRMDFESNIEKRKEEIEAYLKDKEVAFEQEKAMELQNINSQKELIAKDLDHTSAEIKRLENVKAEIAMDHEQREKEWSEIKNSIEVLDVQREKLQKQRESLHLDREEINQQIQRLKRLEELEIETENRALSELKSLSAKPNELKSPVLQLSNVHLIADGKDQARALMVTGDGMLAASIPEDKLNGSAPPPPPKLSASTWLRKCTDVIFRRSPDSKGSINHAGDEQAPKLERTRKVIAPYVHADHNNESNLKTTFESSHNNAKVVRKVKHGNDPNSGVQPEDDVAWDMVKNGPGSSILGRRRVADAFPHDDADAHPEQNLMPHKRKRQNDGDHVEEATSNRPFLPSEIHENGGQHKPEDSPHVCNGAPSKQGCKEDEISFEVEESKFGVDFPADNGGNVEHAEEDEDSEDESEEDEEPTSLKEKFWKFMFT